MDKFGIFNLLSSVLGVKKADENEKTKNFASDSPLSARAENPLFGRITGENTQAEQRATFAPLQSSMLETMKNHEEFIKRVKRQTEKNAKR